MPLVEIYPGFAHIGRDPARLCSDLLDHDIADARFFFFAIKNQLKAPKVPTRGISCLLLCFYGIGLASMYCTIMERCNIMIPTNQSTALMDLDQ